MFVGVDYSPRAYRARELIVAIIAPTIIYGIGGCVVEHARHTADIGTQADCSKPE